jgi:hypothetical protein
VRVGLLGTLEVTVGGEPVDVGGGVTPAVDQEASGVARRVAATADRLGVARGIGVDLGT